MNYKTTMAHYSSSFDCAPTSPRYNPIRVRHCPEYELTANPAKSKAKSKTEHYAEMFFPGVLMSESTVIEVAKKDVSKINVPDGCFAVVFFDKVVLTLDGETLRGPRKNVTGRIYIEATVYTDKEMEAMYDALKRAGKGADWKTLISNMRGNRWARMVKTRVGNWQPFEDNDKVWWPA